MIRLDLEDEIEERRKLAKNTPQRPLLQEKILKAGRRWHPRNLST
jgi:hypothetical protein